VSGVCVRVCVYVSERHRVRERNMYICIMCFILHSCRAIVSGECRVRERVCVCVRESVREGERERVCESERERECVCV